MDLHVLRNVLLPGVLVSSKHSCKFCLPSRYSRANNLPIFVFTGTDLVPCPGILQQEPGHHIHIGIIPGLGDCVVVCRCTSSQITGIYISRPGSQPFPVTRDLPVADLSATVRSVQLGCCVLCPTCSANDYSVIQLAIRFKLPQVSQQLVITSSRRLRGPVRKNLSIFNRLSSESSCSAQSLFGIDSGNDILCQTLIATDPAKKLSNHCHLSYHTKNTVVSTVDPVTAQYTNRMPKSMVVDKI